MQKTLQAKNPHGNPPRAVTGPILLTGLAHCATCGGAMTLRTGTSKSGKVYRYYTCSSAMRIGETACKGRSIPMDKLDQLVTHTLFSARADAVSNAWTKPGVALICGECEEPLQVEG